MYNSSDHGFFFCTNVSAFHPWWVHWSAEVVLFQAAPLTVAQGHADFQRIDSIFFSASPLGVLLAGKFGFVTGGLFFSRRALSTYYFAGRLPFPSRKFGRLSWWPLAIFFRSIPHGVVFCFFFSVVGARPFEARHWVPEDVGDAGAAYRGLVPEMLEMTGDCRDFLLCAARSFMARGVLGISGG